MDSLDQTAALDAALDACDVGPVPEVKGMGLGPPEDKMRRMPSAARAAADDPRAVKQAIVEMGKELLRQGEVIDGMAREPSTLREAHERKQRVWGTYQDLLNRRTREAKRGRGVDPLTTHQLRRLDRVFDRINDLDRKLRHHEVRANRPPFLASRYPGIGGMGGKSHDRLAALLNSPAAKMYRAGVNRYLKTGATTYQGIPLSELAQKAMGSDLNPEGGYVVLPQHERSPLMTFLRQLSPMRQLATIKTTGTGELIQPTILSSSAAVWAGERDVVGETGTPSVGEDRIPVFELRANPKVTQVLLDDAYVDLEAFLTQEVGTTFAERESEAFITGNGVLQPRGLLSYDFVTDHSLWAHGKFRLVETGADAAFPAFSAGPPATGPDNVLIDVITAVKKPNRVGAQWLFNRKTAGVIRKFKDANGLPLWQPSTQAGQPDMLLGFSIAEDEYMPDIGIPETGSNAIAVGFGNWQKTYVVVDRIGVTVLRDPYTAEGNVIFKVRKRVGGAVQYFDAACFLRFA